MFNFKVVSKIFSDFINNPLIVPKYKKELDNIIWLNIKTNQEQWKLEDQARIVELGTEHIAITKQEIDRSNQIRNDLIRKIDIEIADQLKVCPGPKEKFYSESPGMIIDRLAILFIKISVIRNLLSLIKETDLQEEYKKKESIILKQINDIGNFLDFYSARLESVDIFFEIQQPVKIYNDERIKKYIKALK